LANRHLARFTRAPAPPSNGGASHAVHQADGELDRGSLSEEVEKNLDPPALRARSLHDRDEAGERPAADLHPITGLERRRRSDDAALVAARGDEGDHAVLHGGRRRTERDEAPHAGRPHHPVVLLEQRDADEEISREERRDLLAPDLEGARQEDGDAALLELLHRVVLLAGLRPDAVPLAATLAALGQRPQR